jgi:hypothetical protein
VIINIKKIFYFFLFFNFLSCDLGDENLNNINMDKLFYKFFGGSKEEYGFSVEKTNDGGYALAGFSTTYGNGSWDIWVIKTDDKGNGLWHRSYGTNHKESAWQILQNDNGGYSILGEHSPSGGPGNGYLIQTNSDGFPVNETSFGGEKNDGVRQIIKTSDGGYAIIGYTYSFAQGGRDMWLIKIDKDGSEQWSKTYGWVYNETGFSLVQTNDDGFILVGSQWNYNVNKHNIWIVKVNKDGEEEWTKKIFENDTGYAHKIIKTNDGLYTIGGVTKKFGNEWFDLWIAKIDFSGNIQWQRIHSTSHIAINEWYTVDLNNTRDGGFICIGPSDQFGVDMDALLIKFDTNGDIEWSNTYGGKDQDIGLSVLQTDDGGYAFVGRSNSGGNGLNDYFFVKTDSIGQSAIFRQ